VTARHDESPFLSSGFAAGTTVEHREILDGRTWCSYPVRMISDEPQVLAVYLDHGAPITFGPGPFRWGPHPWQALGDRWLSPGVLQLQRPGDHYAVWVRSDPRNGAPDGWYINFQKPFSRRTNGIDTLDYILDIIVSPSGEYRWKDEDEFDAAAASGKLSPGTARAVRWAAETVAADLERGRLWWDDERWSRWSATDERSSAGQGAGRRRPGGSE
jgi:hypothetical protein